MGKRKIKLELIQDKKMRYVSCNNPYFFIPIPDCLIENLFTLQICYNKRKRGLIKKAMEVVLLTGTRVLMTIYDPVEGRFTTYFSHDKP